MDNVAVDEKRLVQRYGHPTAEYTRHNAEIASYGPLRKLSLAPRTLWAWDTFADLRDLLRSQRPDVAHFTNTFPVISPAAYYACRNAGVPVVQSLHNYQMLCPAGTLMRDGRPCSQCQDLSLLRSIRHACFRNSPAMTAVIASMLALHRRLGTYERLVDRYIVLARFMLRILSDGGLPADRIRVKRNFLDPDPGERTGTGSYAVFVGRIAAEKGVRTLLDAWHQLPGSIPLKIIGEGPLDDEVRATVARRNHNDVEIVGLLPRDQVLATVKRARFLVMPSEWYECLPLTIIEAFACGVPVIASRLGAMEEMIRDGDTGLHFTPGNATELAERVTWAWSHPEELEHIGKAGRREYEAKYTAERNYERLVEIYREVAAARFS